MATKLAENTTAKIDIHVNILDFSGSSAGKESAGSAGDPALIPGSGRSYHIYENIRSMIYFSSVQSLSHVRLFATP